MNKITSQNDTKNRKFINNTKSQCSRSANRVFSSPLPLGKGTLHIVSIQSDKNKKHRIFNRLRYTNGYLIENRTDNSETVYSAGSATPASRKALRRSWQDSQRPQLFPSGKGS